VPWSALEEVVGCFHHDREFFQPFWRQRFVRNKQDMGDNKYEEELNKHA
jgi:hypothetical protein